MKSSDEFIEMCKKGIVKYFNCHCADAGGVNISEENVYVVWSCKTSLQNYKALLSTTVQDGMYYEMTFNGDQNELYMDAYKKWDNSIVYKGESMGLDAIAKSR
jgi:hypothetical protein